FGAIKNLMEEDSIYKNTVNRMKGLGAEIIEFTPPDVELEGFLSILNIDMRNDLKGYLATQTDTAQVSIASVADAVAFNAIDSTVRIPYGQALFEGILADSTTAEGLNKIKSTLEKEGRTFFDSILDKHQLDAILSINNSHAAFAAVAKYPALPVPMGYTFNGEPVSLTFIAKSFEEHKLLRLGCAFEKATKVRKMPNDY
ncbi:MAG: amidase, partial [Pricia sp.]|nr:amidase [Pricia sp.]